MAGTALYAFAAHPAPPAPAADESNLNFRRVFCNAARARLKVVVLLAGEAGTRFSSASDRCRALAGSPILQTSLTESAHARRGDGQFPASAPLGDRRTGRYPSDGAAERRSRCSPGQIGIGRIPQRREFERRNCAAPVLCAQCSS